MVEIFGRAVPLVRFPRRFCTEICEGWFPHQGLVVRHDTLHHSLTWYHYSALLNFQAEAPKKHLMKAALKAGVEKGTLIQVKSSYKLSADAKKETKPKKPVVKKVVAAPKKKVCRRPCGIPSWSRLSYLWCQPCWHGTMPDRYNQKSKKSCVCCRPACPFCAINFNSHLLLWRPTGNHFKYYQKDYLEKENRCAHQKGSCCHHG